MDTGLQVWEAGCQDAEPSSDLSSELLLPSLCWLFLALCTWGLRSEVCWKFPCETYTYLRRGLKCPEFLINLSFRHTHVHTHTHTHTLTHSALSSQGPTGMARYDKEGLRTAQLCSENKARRKVPTCRGKWGGAHPPR